MPKQQKPYGGRESFLIFLVVGGGIIATLSFNMFSVPTLPPEGRPLAKEITASKAKPSKENATPVSLIDVPLATGNEPIDKLFVQSGCAVCHTIPGIAPAQGRQGPRLVLGTTGPLRLADPEYHGTAESVREYIQESVLNPGAFVVPGYSDRVMPRWYGKRLNAKSLDRIATYLENIDE